ncbi:hypothetical protein PVAND_010499 [Polypedilum vanderplanki]|uniref:Uncharacterized protein n=1 Tax=Polypedilum vanderplanki TaxID=319348 RepID=A0A9J6CFR4_POLVA|nr:hypothetical protein PVAND_010499 [Polypedilum vanderplanki]
MKFSLLVIASLLINLTKATHNCSSFNDRNHGFGCELRNVKPEDGNFEINVMTRENDSNKTEEDIIWVQIRDSQFTTLPNGVFERFTNMEKIMILSSTGFQILNNSYFDKKISLVLLKNTDLEVIGINAFNELNNLKILSLNYNKITTIHKSAFRDLVKMEKIEMVSNNIETLDPDIFENNVNLKLVLLYHNKIKVIPTQLFSRNVNIETLQLQNNSISQIEKNFHKTLEKLTKADFSSNICISESISVTRFIQWNSHLFKFKDCFNNYALMKSTNEVVYDVKNRLINLESQVKDMVERVDNDLTVLEGKMKNETSLEEFKTNLMNFFENDKKTFEAKYENDLNNITSHVRTNMMDEIKRNVVKALEQSSETQQAKLVSDDFENFRDELSGKFTFIYCVLFVILIASCIVGFLMIQQRWKFYPTFHFQNDNRKLIEAEVC